MATTAVALSMKLLIDRKAQRVLFAEASKDVVDFLFSLLALPVATAVKLVGKDAMVGNLYASVDKLDSTYVQPGAAKDALLRPTVLSTAAAANSSPLCLPAAPPSSGQPKSFYRCYSCYNCVTDVKGTSCPSCAVQMTSAMQYVPAGSGSSAKKAKDTSTGAANGFVQGIVTYTVLDDLTVAPMSARHLQHHPAQHLRGPHPRRPAREDRAARLQRGLGDPQGPCTTFTFWNGPEAKDHTKLAGASG